MQTEAIPFFDSKSLPDISLPSNLQEILASIKSSTSSAPPITTPTLDPKSDPIVKAYTSSKFYENPAEEEDDEEYIPPALQAEATPPPQEKTSRDPRQRPEAPRSKTSLSQLSDAELIRKAAEMEEKTKEEEALKASKLAGTSQQSYYARPPVVPPVFPPQPPFPGGPPPMLYPPQPPLPVIMPLDKGPPPLPLERGKRKSIEDKVMDYKSDKRGRRPPKWEEDGVGRGMFKGMPRGIPPMRGMPPMGRGGRFRGGFENRARFRGGFHRGVPFRPDFRPKFDGIQSEWEEEIRNFEQRKTKEAERRKRKASRSPSPRRRSRSPSHRKSRKNSS